MASTHPIPTNPRFKNITGQRFGRLVAVSYSGSAGGQSLWLCRCDCGRSHTVRKGNLVSGQCRSCGCLASDNGTRNTSHGHWRGNKPSPTYASYMSMLTRCTNPLSTDYPRYGGRGITVCERWLSFANFLADMGERPAGMTLDRKENSGNYEPGNCRWATLEEQMRNRSDNVRLSFDGQTLCVSEWSHRVGIATQVLYKRVLAGWSVERALTTPVRPYRRVTHD